MRVDSKVGFSFARTRGQCVVAILACALALAGLLAPATPAGAAPPDPAAPNLQTATFVDGGVRLAFTAPTQQPSGASITDYYYEVSLDGGATVYAGETSVGQVTSPAVIGNGYCPADGSSPCSYRLEAVFDSGTSYSHWSDWVTAPALGVPSVSSAVIDDNGAKLTFTPPALPSGATVTDYYVQMSDDGGTTVTYGDFSLGQTTSPAVAPRSFYCSSPDGSGCAFRIKALINNGVWFTGYSNWRALTPIAAPTITASTVTDAGVQIDYVAAALPSGATVTDYYAEFSDDGGTTNVYGPVSLGQTTNPLIASNYYGYYYGYCGYYYAGTDSNQCAVRIQAVVGNGAWYTPWSNWSVPPLGAPAITASNITDAGLQIDFTAPAVSPAATITDYYAEFSNDGGATVAYGPVSLGQTTSPIVSNYYYGYYYGYCGYYYYDQNNPNQCAVRIRAVIGNGAWFSPWSNWSTAPLGAPTITAATLVEGGVQLDITPPAVAPGATITDYYVEISTDGGASAYGPYSVGQSTGPLFVPQAFYYSASDGTGLCALRVLAVIGNGAWYSPWSSWRTFTDDVAPTASLSLDSTSGTAPFNVAATVGGTDPDNTPLTYSLDFGDGTAVQSGSLPSAPVAHTYLESGVYTARLVVSDGELSAATTESVSVGLSEPLAANAGDDVSTVTGNSVDFDGSASRPLIGINSYTWDFGDGSGTATGAHVSHTYTQAGSFAVTLTVQGAGSSSTDTSTATVTAPPVGSGTHVHVTDAGGAPIVGAAVVVMDADGAKHAGMSDPGGTATLAGLPDGTFTAYAWHDGYEPNTGPISVAGGNGDATIALTAGSVGQASMTATRLTYDQILAAGIDPNDPANQNVFEFEIHLAFVSGSFTQDISFSGFTTGDGFYGAGFSGGSGGGGGGGGCLCTSVGGGGGGYTVYPTLQYVGSQPTILWLIIPGKAKWLKEFFEVKMGVTNLAPSGFTFQGGRASLGDLPAGLSLAPTGTPQTIVQNLADIPSQDTQFASWILRGDAEGYYAPTADYSGTLEPLGAPVSLHAQTAADAIHVWGGSAVHMIVDADDSVTTGYPYRVRIGLQNVSDVPVYNPGVELLTTGRLNYIYQPSERLEQGAAVIQPGETFYTDYYRLVPEITGVLDLADSFVKKTGGNVDVASTIVSHPANPPGAAPHLTATTLADGVHVSWDAVAGAQSYELFTTPNRDTLFGDTPDLVVPGTQLSAVLPTGTTGFVAVSTVLAGVNTMVHPLAAISTGGGGQLTHLALSPSSATIGAGQPQSYTAEGSDGFGNDMGDMTAFTIFTISPDGSCTGNVCTPAAPGAHTVTGTAGLLPATGTASLIVKQVPVITWANPAAITYPTALSSKQLNAKASVPGTFVYSPASGSRLPAGTNTLSVTFTPTDGVHYVSVTKQVSLTVKQFVSKITWATPTPILYTTPVSAIQLNATANAPGTITYDVALGTVLSPGSHKVTATFHPTDPVNYTSVTKSVTIKVLKNGTTTVLGLTSPLSFGHENSAPFTVDVTAAFGPIPTGKIAIKAGATTLCTAVLDAAGHGSCITKPTKLPVGTYQVTALYGGSTLSLKSTSAPMTLVVNP